MNTKLTLSALCAAAALVGAESPATAQTLAHRYSFNDPSGSVSLTDSVGGAAWDGYIYVDSLFPGGAYLDGSRLQLTGQGGYGILPSGLISSETAVTVEFWASFGTNAVWSRVWAFGSQNAGAKATGVDYCHYASGNYQNLDYKGSSASGYVNNAGGLNGAQNVHVTAVIDPANNQMLYYNGIVVRSSSLHNGPLQPLNTIADDFGLLGRSLVDADPTLLGSIEEFRIYSGVLTKAQVVLNDTVGPDTYVSTPGALISLNLQSPVNPIYIGATSTQVFKGNFANVTGLDLVAYGGATFQSQNTSVLTVSAAGVVTGVAPGTTGVIASYGGQSVTNPLTVIETPLTDGLVSWWPLDSSDGVAALDNFGVNDLTSFNGPSVVPGPFGNAFSFDGATQYLSLTHGSNPGVSGLPIYKSTANGYTVAFWVKGAPQTGKTIFSESSLSSVTPIFLIATGQTDDANNKLDIYLRGNSGGQQINHNHSFATVFDNAWHHIGFSDKQGSISLYIDGVLDKTIPYSPGTYTFDTTSLGGLVRSSGTSGNFAGQVDDLALWNRALSQADINRVRANSLGSTPAPVSLAIAFNNGNVELSWPTAATGFSLQAATSLNPPNWQAVPQSPTVVGDRQVISISPGGPTQFFRLIK